MEVKIPRMTNSRHMAKPCGRPQTLMKVARGSLETPPTTLATRPVMAVKLWCEKELVT
jgi:hypothetical protein